MGLANRQMTPHLPQSPAPAEGEEDRIEAFHAYDLLCRFDNGGMAEAYRARSRDTGQIVFLKRVRRNSIENDALQREMGIYERLMRMNTPHVLRVLDFVRDNDYLAFVTEYADGGDLPNVSPRTAAVADCRSARRTKSACASPRR